MVRGGVTVCDIEVVYEPKTVNQDIATSMTEIRSPRKLIEVAVPLDDINVAAAREESMQHGHPSTLHLWWARRPLAAARTVLFAQVVNDPGYQTAEASRGASTRR